MSNEPATIRASRIQSEGGVSSAKIAAIGVVFAAVVTGIFGVMRNEPNDEKAPAAPYRPVSFRQSIANVSQGNSSQIVQSMQDSVVASQDALSTGVMDSTEGEFRSVETPQYGDITTHAARNVKKKPNIATNRCEKNNPPPPFLSMRDPQTTEHPSELHSLAIEHGDDSLGRVIIQSGRDTVVLSKEPPIDELIAILESRYKSALDIISRTRKELRRRLDERENQKLSRLDRSSRKNIDVRTRSQLRSLSQIEDEFRELTRANIIALRKWQFVHSHEITKKLHSLLNSQEVADVFGSQKQERLKVLYCGGLGLGKSYVNSHELFLTIFEPLSTEERAKIDGFMTLDCWQDWVAAVASTCLFHHYSATGN